MGSMDHHCTSHGRKYRAGWIPRPAPRDERFPRWGSRESCRVLPRDQWKPLSHAHFVPEILDQDGQGACTAFGSIGALRSLRRMQGLGDTGLSPGNLYGRINGGRDAGSAIGDAIDELQTRGVCTTDLVATLGWRKWDADGWEEEGKKYRVVEAYDCPDFEALASALQLGFFVVYGISTGRNFDVGSDGWVQRPVGSGGGHCMYGCGLAQKGTAWGIETVNSWGADWGNGGMAVVPEAYFARSPFTDGYAIRVAVDPEDDRWEEVT